MSQEVLKRVVFPLAENQSFLIKFIEDATGDKYGMHVWAVDKVQAKKKFLDSHSGVTVFEVEPGSPE